MHDRIPQESRRISTDSPVIEALFVRPAAILSLEPQEDGGDGSERSFFYWRSGKSQTV